MTNFVLNVQDAECKVKTYFTNFLSDQSIIKPKFFATTVWIRLTLSGAIFYIENVYLGKILFIEFK